MQKSDWAVIDRHDTRTVRFKIGGDSVVGSTEIADTVRQLDSVLAAELLMTIQREAPAFFDRNLMPDNLVLGAVTLDESGEVRAIVHNHAPPNGMVDGSADHFRLSVSDLVSVERGSIIMTLALMPVITFVGVAVGYGVRRSSLKSRLVEWGMLSGEALSFCLSRVNASMRYFLTSRGHEIDTELEMFVDGKEVARSEIPSVSRATKRELNTMRKRRERHKRRLDEARKEYEEYHRKAGKKDQEPPTV